MNRNFEMVSRVLQLMVSQRDERWSLAQLAGHFGVSEYHLQRTFSRMAGVSPKKFQQFLDKQQAVEHLKKGLTVMDTTFEMGLSGPGRLHDLIVATEAMTPGEARSMGRGVFIEYGAGITPFGPAVVAWTHRGLSFLGFANDQSAEQVSEQMKSQWRGADWSEHNVAAQRRLDGIFTLRHGESIKVWLKGTPFQLKVWEALLRIPPATRVSYGQLARVLGRPNASRAVGTAIGRNPVSWLIPCHRVITSLGTPGGYRWGVATKQVMNSWEDARIQGAA
jgi:AraC family transcriptional regulator, regulatory protein of adaptative response / methylated-DNA-[protein]-cysteine methyltransferase